MRGKIIEQIEDFEIHEEVLKDLNDGEEILYKLKVSRYNINPDLIKILAILLYISMIFSKKRS